MIRGLLALVVVCPSLFAQDTFSGKVIKLRTAHYELQCDVGPAFTKEVAQHLEAVYAEYYRRLRDFGGKIKERFNVHIYKEKADYLKLVGPNLAGTAGIYIPRNKLLAAYVGPMTNEEVLRTVYHEGFHQFTDAFLGGIGNMPPWISEGMAQIFEDATWSNRKLEIGEVPSFRLHLLNRVRQERKWIPLGDLVEMDRRQWGANIQTDQMLATAEYQESWSVVHFLIYANRGKYRKALINYLRYLNQQQTPLAAFKKAFGSNMAGFDSRWMAYLKNLKPSPKFQCRENLMLLGVLMNHATGESASFADIAAYRVKVAGLFDHGLVLTPYGKEAISSKTPKSAARLFQCPSHEKAESEPSYQLTAEVNAADKDALLKSASIRCLHHGSVTISVKLVRDDERNTYRPVVEETVGKKK